MPEDIQALREKENIQASREKEDIQALREKEDKDNYREIEYEEMPEAKQFDEHLPKLPRFNLNNP